MGQNIILSTGVLVRDPSSVNAHVDIVNIDNILSQTVTVQVLDWGVDQRWSDPTPVPVSPAGPVIIAPNTHQSFIALITESTAQPSLKLSLYEIRVTIPGNQKLVVNCFALDLSGTVIAANTLVQQDLVDVTGATSPESAHITGMIDAVADAGADNTGVTDATLALSNAVAMCFGFSTMAQLDAALPPTTKVRQPTKWLYLPPGTYQLLEPLVLQSMQGLVIRGGGRFNTALSVQGGTVTSPVLAGLELNGVAQCTFKDFAVSTDGAGDVRALIYLHWDPARAGRSTTQNTFYSVLAASTAVEQAGNAAFRDAAWQIGTLHGDGPQGFQCDQTAFFDCITWGGYDNVRGDRTIVTTSPTERDVVPANAPFTITVNNSATATADLGVHYLSTGQPLTRVAQVSAAGQYSIGSPFTGTYTFSASDSNAGVLISYSYTVMKKDLYYQRGFRFGDGEYGNNGWHHAHGLVAHHCRYGVDWWAAECPIFGGLIQSNDIDLYASEPPASYITVKNIRSEDSGRFFGSGAGGGNTNMFHASLEDCHWTIPGGNSEVLQSVTAATAGTLTDTSQNWSPANKWTGYIARIVSGKAADQERRITASSSDQLTLASDWTVTPDPTSLYAISPAATGGTTSSLVNIGANWQPNLWRGWYVYLLSGPGKGQVGWVDGSSADTLSIDNSHADIVLPPWTAAPDVNTAYALAKIPPDGEFIQWNFAGVFRISGMQAYGPIHSELGIHHRIGLHASVRQCTALVDGASLGETTRAQAFAGASPLAAIDVRGWESCGIFGQIENDSETGQILINSGQAVDVKTVTASTALDKLHDHVRVDASGGAVTITLPDAQRFIGRRFTIKKIDASAHAVTIQGLNGQTIDGAASESSHNEWAVFRLYSTGDNWETD
jgi:hypothetical protein